ncbi:hypothetical protein PDESU_04576 [Pontiella desulfatans]|uniref:Uncharacterized protein n=1 Tax=Pontiella desulfatans TaxID=2750659 RepID=A0A6C2U8D7_PONDE|nr:hypothetical protein [Pontiella desulfatans]VGO15987.1 hypothetical protein PDESU_04576 [Pontiella desulfatans]
MEDLVPFLIFIVIALVNLVKFILEKGVKGKQPPAVPGQKPPRKEPGTIEEFFENLAGKLEPQPSRLPDWPEGYERPDYMKEMEEFETGPPATFEEPVAEPVPTPPPAPMPIPGSLKAAAATHPLAQAEPMEMALKSMPSSIASLKGLRIATPAILRSNSAGRINFPLGNKADLRKAIIANLIFSPPRAYATDFENTVVK